MAPLALGRLYILDLHSPEPHSRIVPAMEEISKSHLYSPNSDYIVTVTVLEGGDESPVFELRVIQNSPCLLSKRADQLIKFNYEEFRSVISFLAAMPDNCEQLPVTAIDINVTASPSDPHQRELRITSRSDDRKFSHHLPRCTTRMEKWLERFCFFLKKSKDAFDQCSD